MDSRGILSSEREDLNEFKQKALDFTNSENISGDLLTAMQGSDVFIGVSVRDLLEKEHIDAMNENPIVFALANPVPEIMPEKAKELGVTIMGTGRADYPNQVNNVLAFPGILKGAMDKGCQIDNSVLIKAAAGLAKCVSEPSYDKVIPGAFDPGVFESVYQEIIKD